VENEIAFSLAPYLIMAGLVTGSLMVVYLGAWAVKRRKEAAWVSAAVDQAAQNVVDAAEEKGLLDAPEAEEKFYSGWSHEELDSLAGEIFGEVQRLFEELRLILAAKKRPKPHGVGAIAPGYIKPLSAREMEGASFVQAMNTVDQNSTGQTKELADLILNKPEEQEQTMQDAAVKLAAEENQREYAAPYVPDEDDEKFFEEVLKETFAKTDECAASGYMCGDCGDDCPLEPVPTVDMLRQEYEKLGDDVLNDHVAAILLATGLEDMLLDGYSVEKPKKAKRKPAKKKAAKKRK